jgi:thiosulfate dehydrogenase
MHTEAGIDDSIAQWVGNGGSYEYQLRWQAPEADTGSVTFFVAGNAINNAEAFLGDRYYTTHATIGHAQPGDADGDGDVDLHDFAVVQRCFLRDDAVMDEACAYVDLAGDEAVSLSDLSGFLTAMSGPTAALPAGYVLADAVRGGQLYDTWWTVTGAAAPSGNHPLYPPGGPRTGSITFRCKECHGWDYKGRDGRYGSGSHATGVRGVFGTEKTAQEIFDLLQASPTQRPNGHDMSHFGLTERDLWDVVKWTKEGVVDTDQQIAANGAFLGDAPAGLTLFDTVCSSCHGFDGRSLNFGSEASPEYVGTVAQENPWEFLHLVRFGHPGTPMPAMDLLRWDVGLATDIGAYSATLPTE